MKKILSLAMVFAMLLSAVGMMTVSAADETTTFPADYPYIYFDFEEANATPGNFAGTMSNYDTWFAGGAAGSKGCVEGTIKADNAASYAEWEIPNLSLDMNAVYTISFWAKIGLESFGTATPNFQTYFLGGSGFKSSTYYVPTTKANQWVKYETTFDMATQKDASWTNQTVFSFRLRFYGFNDLKGLQPAENQATFEFPLSVDDVVIEPIREHVVAEDPLFDDSFVTAVTSENDGADDVNAARVASRSGLDVATVDTPDATTAQHGNKVLKVTKLVSTYGDLFLGGNLKYNHRYKISASIKPVSTSASPAYQLFDVHVPNWGNTVVTDATTGAAETPATPAITLTNNTWNSIEHYICNEAVTFDDGPAFVAMLRFGSATGQGAIFYIDNLFIEDLGIVGNGNFESTVAVGDLWRPNSTTKTGAHDVFAWYGVDGATAALNTTDVRPSATGETASTKSMQVTVSTAGGRVHQPVDFAHNQAHTISFWAKNPNLADGEEQDISIKLDRNDATPDNVKDIFIYPDGAIETVAETNWKLTNQWQKFTTTYTPTFATTGGATPAANVAPRKPYMYFDVDGNEAGTSFLLDDIVIEKVVTPPPAYPYPYIENALATSDTIAGKDATFTYTFTSEIGKAERTGGSIMRLLGSNDGVNYTSHGQTVVSGGNGTFAVPEDAAGKYYKVEILAIDADGTYGEIATVNFGQALVSFDVAVTYPTWNVAGNQITASVAIQNNLAENADEELVVILAVYSENNTLLYTTSSPVTLTGSFNNTSSPVVLSSVVNFTDGAEPVTAHHAKVFVWGGTTVADAGDSIWKVAESYSPAA